MWHIHALLNFKLLDLPRTYHFSSVHSHINHHGAAMTHRTATATTETQRDTARRSIGQGSRRCGRMVGRRAHPPKWFVFSFFSLYYTDIDYSTTGDPLLLPADLTKSAKINRLLWPPHPLSTVTWNPWKQVRTLVFRGCGCPLTTIPYQPSTSSVRAHSQGLQLSLATTAYQQSHKPRDWVSVLAFGGRRLPLGQGHCHHCQQPPEPLKSSVHARFQWLWATRHHHSQVTP